MTCNRRKLGVLTVGATLLLVYAATLFQMPRHVFWAPDEGTNYLAARSVRLGDGLEYRTVYGGRTIDPDLRFFASPSLYPRPSIASNGKTHLAFGMMLGFALVSRYMMEAFGVSGLYLIPMLSGWFVALLGGRIAWLIDRRLAIPATLLIGLGTPIFFYSMLFWEHTAATLCGTLIAWLMIEAPLRPRLLLGAGLPLLIAAVSLRVEMLAFALAVLGCAVFLPWFAPRPASDRMSPKQRSIVPPWVALPLLFCTAGLFIYFFQSLLSERHRDLLALIPERIGAIPARLHEIPTSLVDILVGSATSEGPHLNEGWANAATVAIGATLAAACARCVRLEAVLILPALLVITVVGLAVALLPEPYRAMHGIFVVAPFAVLWPYAFRGAWQRRDWRVGTLGCLAVLHLLFGFAAIFLTYVVDGRLVVSLEWGQRYLLMLYPVLTVLALIAVRDYWVSQRPTWLRFAVCSIALVLALLGVGMEARGLRMLGESRRVLATWEDTLRQREPIVTDLWWLPGALASMYEHHLIFCIRAWSDLAEWMPLAEAHGIGQFTFVSVTAGKEGPVGSYVLRQVPQKPEVVERLTLSRFEFAKSPTPPRTETYP